MYDLNDYLRAIDAYREAHKRSWERGTDRQYWLEQLGEAEREAVAALTYLIREYEED